MRDEKTEARKSLRERLREAQENYDSMFSAHRQESERADQFEAEAKRLRAEHARTCELVSAAKAECDLLRIERDARAAERDAARAALSAFQAEHSRVLEQLREAQAQAAAMLNALDASDGKVSPLTRVLYEIETFPERDLESLRGALTAAARRVRNALSSDAGRTLLERVERAEAQLETARSGFANATRLLSERMGRAERERDEALDLIDCAGLLKGSATPPPEQVRTHLGNMVASANQTLAKVQAERDAAESARDALQARVEALERAIAAVLGDVEGWVATELRAALSPTATEEGK